MDHAVDLRDRAGPWSGCSTRSRRSSSARTTCSSGWPSRCWPAATSSSKACPAWPRRWPSRPSRRRSAASSSASSSRPTSSRPTWSGTRIYNQKTGEFSTSLGPVFTNLLLADEINRAPAKVQSALLEVMQEHQVTIGHDTFKVPDAVPRAGHPEPDRDRGHLRAARGAGRPLHAQGAGRLPEPRPRSSSSSSG